MIEIDNKQWYSWFSGFVDGEGCFTVSIQKSKSNSCGYSVHIRFEIGLSVLDKDIIKEICRNVGVGTVIISSNKKLRKNGINAHDAVRYFVSSTDDLRFFILPIFNKYPLKTKKNRDFQIWSKILRCIINKEHLTLEGINKIKKLRIEMNGGSKSTRDDTPVGDLVVK